MTKRNQSHQRKAEQIKAYIKRRQNTGHGMKVHVKELGRLIELQDGETGDSEFDRAVKEYIVVKLVATLQSAFQDVFRLAVDSMSTRGESIPDFGINISIPMVQDLIKKDYSLGVFVSTSLPLNSYKQMKTSFEQVTNQKFEDILRTAPEIDNCGFFENGMDKQALDMIYKDLEELFEKRNCICHELTDERIVAEKKLSDWTFVSIPVIQALEFYESKFVPKQAKEGN